MLVSSELITPLLHCAGCQRTTHAMRRIRQKGRVITSLYICSESLRQPFVLRLLPTFLKPKVLTKVRVLRKQKKSKEKTKEYYIENTKQDDGVGASRSVSK